MPSCPDPDQLRAYESGQLADDSADRLSRHVHNCPACAQRLERFRGENLDARVIRAAVRVARPETPAENAAPSAVDFQAGHVWDIPDYKRVRLCGEGAFGTVWAVQDRVGVFRALKTINLAHLRSANAQCRESTALEAYCRHVERHPNLIQVFHVGMRGSMLYYTMELADNAATRKPVRDALPDNYRPLTLNEVLTTGQINAETAIEVVLRLLRGLAHLHALGLAHRDLKPANIVFVDRRPKLADIGMITSDTTTPSHVGTPDYMPPDGRMDLTADTYAMSRILYELVVGPKWDDFPELPWAVERATDAWDLTALAEVLATAAQPRADDRYPHAARMLEALEACRCDPFESLLAELDTSATRPPRPRRLTPIIVAAIRALPWILLLILAIILATRLP